MLNQAVEALKRGEVIALPTEAVYGLSADPYQPEAVQKILELKHRNPEKGLIIVGASFDQLEPLIKSFTPEMEERIFPTWPGPHTWVVPAGDEISPFLTGKHKTLAIRVTAHPDLQALCKALGGPVISTSANHEGQPPALSEQAVRDYFGESLFILPGNLGGLEKTTEIRDGLTGQLIR